MPEQFWSPLVHGVLTCCEIYIIRPKQWNSFCLLMAFEDVEKWTHLIRGREFQTVHFFCWIWCQNYAPCFIHAIWISKLEWPNGVAPFDVLQIYNVQPVAKKTETFYWESRCRQKGNANSKLWLPHTNTVLRCKKQCHEKIFSFYQNWEFNMLIFFSSSFFILNYWKKLLKEQMSPRGKSEFKTYTHLGCHLKRLFWEVRTNIIKELLFIISTVRIQSEWDCSKLYVISGLSCSKEWLVPRRLKIVF